MGETLAYEQPTKYMVISPVYDDSHPVPVLTAGKTFILGYTDEMDGIYKASPANPVIIFDDFTTAFKWVDFPFKVKSSAIKIIKPKPGVAENLRYVYYLMQTIPYAPKNHARQWIQVYSKIRIPLPSHEEQARLVAILDAFDALVNNLSDGLPAEIAARRKQYRYYRDTLLSFTDAA